LGNPATTGFAPDLLQGKVALVAGASSGINLAIARRLASSGARVAMLSRSAERIEAAGALVAARGAGARGRRARL